ncbi:MULTISPECIES: MFS transporter [Glutamicibacter]|uniref:MFS transporter n=2 Tax=Glutamicibacter halophytocola TaxID=1933880 RepID=A0AA94XYI8_9MICC|nr:MFS transporter [Glutamicibacter halophytocola]UUX59195.1 MFS transporter [Glutamicibacter halophytocola]
MVAGSKASSSGIMRWLVILIATGLLSQTALNLVRPVTTYKLISFGSGSFTVGAVTAAYAILPLFTAMMLGRVSSRIRRIRFLMVAGVGLIAVGGLGINLAPNALAVALASAVLGLGHLMFTIGGQSSIARYFPDSDLDKGFGWFTAAYAAGQFIGPLIAGMVLGSGTDAVSAERIADISLSLWIGMGAALLAVPFLLPNWQPRVSKSVSAASPERSSASIGSVLRIKGMASHIFASMTLLSMLDILTAFLPLVAEKHNVTPAAVGVLLAIRGCASVVSRLFIPKLSAHFERRDLLVTSLYVAGVSIALAPVFIDVLWASGLALLIGGFFLGLGQPMTMTMISTSVPPVDRGAALAVRLMGNRLGQVALPVISSTVAAGLGPAGAVWFCCALLCLSGAEKNLRH